MEEQNTSRESRVNLFFVQLRKDQLYLYGPNWKPTFFNAMVSKIGKFGLKLSLLF